MKEKSFKQFLNERNKIDYPMIKYVVSMDLCWLVITMGGNEFFLGAKLCKNTVKQV